MRKRLYKKEREKAACRAAVAAAKMGFEFEPPLRKKDFKRAKVRASRKYLALVHSHQMGFGRD